MPFYTFMSYIILWKTQKKKKRHYECTRHSFKTSKAHKNTLEVSEK